MIGKKCPVCKMPSTKAGHDFCIADLPGVRYACCGHGSGQRGYIAFDNGTTIYGVFEDIYRESTGGDYVADLATGVPSRGKRFRNWLTKERFF